MSYVDLDGAVADFDGASALRELREREARAVLTYQDKVDRVLRTLEVSIDIGAKDLAQRWMASFQEGSYIRSAETRRVREERLIAIAYVRRARQHFASQVPGGIRPPANARRSERVALSRLVAESPAGRLLRISSIEHDTIGVFLYESGMFCLEHDDCVASREMSLACRRSQ